MENRRNYYRILQVQPDAPFEVIHVSYCTLLRELKQHPDLGGDHWNAAILNEAYDTLSDSKKRAEYDKKLFNYYTKKTVFVESSKKQPIITIFCPICKRPLARKSLPNENCPICKNSSQSLNKKNTTQAYCRSVNRIKKVVKIRYFTSSIQKEHEAKMIDLSPKGMRFLCTEKLDPNMTIKIKCSLLNSISKVMDFQQELLKGRNHYAVGVHFLTVTFNDQEGTFFSAVV